MRLPGILALLVLSLPSCFAGYGWVHYEGALGDIQTIAIEGLRNESLEPGVDSIVSDASIGNVRRIAKQSGMITLGHDGFRKVREGITTVEEIFRIVGDIGSLAGSG